MNGKTFGQNLNGVAVPWKTWERAEKENYSFLIRIVGDKALRIDPKTFEIIENANMSAKDFETCWLQGKLAKEYKFTKENIRGHYVALKSYGKIVPFDANSENPYLLRVSVFGRVQIFDKRGHFRDWGCVSEEQVLNYINSGDYALAEEYQIPANVTVGYARSGEVKDLWNGQYITNELGQMVCKSGAKVSGPSAFVFFLLGVWVPLKEKRTYVANAIFGVFSGLDKYYLFMEGDSVFAHYLSGQVRPLEYITVEDTKEYISEGTWKVVSDPFKDTQRAKEPVAIKQATPEFEGKLIGLKKDGKVLPWKDASGAWSNVSYFVVWKNNGLYCVFSGGQERLIDAYRQGDVALNIRNGTWAVLPDFKIGSNTFSFTPENIKDFSRHTLVKAKDVLNSLDQFLNNKSN
jgi:hypothetical protein